jgi:hypothetical protein
MKSTMNIPKCPIGISNHMNTILHHKLGKMWMAFGSVLTAGLVLAAPCSATADTPIKSPFSFDFTNVLTDGLPFPVTIHSVGSGTEIDYFDQNGALTRIYQHQTEQDTFTANGKTLVGIPYTTDVEQIFDGDGNLIHFYVSGGVEKIRLPDGTLFITAGRTDFVEDANFLLSPEKGNQGKLDDLIAALSP